MSVVDHDKKWLKLKKELKLLDKSYTEVGLQDDGKEYPDDDKKVAQVGFDNEYGVTGGSGKWKVPPRPFMSTSFDENRNKMNGLITREYDKVIAGSITVKNALSLVGEWMTGVVKMKITNIKSPPNAEYTKQKKGSSNPLIDSGRMRASITHKEVIK